MCKKMKQNKIHNPRGDKICTRPGADITHGFRRWSQHYPSSLGASWGTAVSLGCVAGDSHRTQHAEGAQQVFPESMGDKHANHPPPPQ